MKMLKILLLIIPIAIAPFEGLAFAPAHPCFYPQDNAAKIKAIIGDTALWGPDFNALISSIKDWSAVGETKIEVFHGEAVGATQQATITLALSNASKFHENLSRSMKLDDSIKSVIPSAQTSRDDGSSRVVLLRRDERVNPTSYLLNGLSVQFVKERRGEPDRVTTQLLDTGDERRPIILTLYEYAGGAIVFAESDVTPPGTVERVILDAKKIQAAISPGGF